MTRWFLLLSFTALLLPVPVSAEPAPVVESDTQTADTAPPLSAFRSRHYVIYTNLTRTETQPLGRHMDQVFDQYQRRFRSFLPGNPDPMPLYLLRTREDYVRFMATHNIDASNSGGMFFVTHSAQGLATWAESGSRQKTYKVLQHEGFHQFAWNYLGPSVPVWVNEGLAQYFEDAVIVNGRMTIGLVGHSRVERVRQAIDNRDLLALPTLMQVGTRQWSATLQHDPDRSALLYAQSWSVVYYLIHGDGGRHQGAFLDYLKLLNRGNRTDQAELLSFGTAGLAGVERDWLRHAADQRPNDVTTATDRLEFLGTGLRLLDEQGRPMPESIDQLREELQRFGFSLRRRELGVTQNQSAADTGLFRFTRGGEEGAGFEADFVLLAPSRSDLPPRIVAPGLSPEPTLIWHRDADGKLVQDIEYR